MSRDADGLTPKQAKFVRFYRQTLNASDAARRAGYSLRTAAAIGLENLEKPRIRAAIDRATRRQAAAQEITIERIIRGIGDIAFPKGRRRVADRDRLRAQELLGKHLGAFVDRQEVSGPRGGPIEFAPRKRLSIEELEDVAAGAPSDGPGRPPAAPGSPISPKEVSEVGPQADPQS